MFFKAKSLINKLLLMGALVLGAAQPAFTEDKDAPFSFAFDPFSVDNFEITTGLSNFGYTITPGYRLNDRFALRAPIGYATRPTEVTSWGQQVIVDLFGVQIQTDIPAQHENVDITAQLSGAGILLDYYHQSPDAGPHQWRSTAGIMFPNYRLGGEGIINDRIIVDGKAMQAEWVKVDMWIGGVAPYLGFGYDYGAEEGWGFNWDIGVLFNIKYEGSIDGRASNPSQQDKLYEGLQKEMREKLDELSNYPLMPYVSVGISYRF